MADNENGSSRSSDSEQGEEDSNPLTIAAKAGAKLSTPAKASISRQRKIQTNPAEKKRNTRGAVDPNVSSWERVQEFKDECLTVVSGKLRCEACKETMSKKKSTVKKHIDCIPEAYQIKGYPYEKQNERSEHRSPYGKQKRSKRINITRRYESLSI